MRAVHAVIAVLLGAGLAGCAGPHASGTFQSKASYDKVYAASIAAVDSLDYTVTSSNKADC